MNSRSTDNRDLSEIEKELRARIEAQRITIAARDEEIAALHSALDRLMDELCRALVWQRS